VAFEHVSFAHGEAHVLRDVSFRVAPGETLALIGPSGCGKSTIVSLLLRLHDADEGEVRVDGMPLDTIDRRWLRGQVATALQEPFLFGRSIRENLVLGRPGAGEEELVEAASAACVHDAITAFEHAYDTRVGERGVTLSGGQRQRVALARALLQEAPILVLDDAISAVDTRTESLILDALRERHGLHTTILVAHRLSTLMHADRVLVLDHGRIVQQGTHAELANVPGLYRTLWRIQNDIELDADEAPSIETTPTRAAEVTR
jgi:ATP-binding cassette subfamily B protein